MVCTTKESSQASDTSPCQGEPTCGQILESECLVTLEKVL